MPAPRTILIVKPSSLGDIIHALPAVALVKKKFPESTLRWVANTEWLPILDGNPTVDAPVEFPRTKLKGRWRDSAAWWRGLSRWKSDLVLDFQGLLRSALISKRCRADGGQILGLRDAREGARFFYDRVADTSSDTHAVDRYLRLAALLGINPPPRDQLTWPLPPGQPPADDAVRALVESGAPFVVLHPFARGAGKSLTAAQTAAIAAALAPVPVIVAGRADAALVAGGNVTDLVNRTTLHELIWLLRRATWVISVDSGPMHIAAALTDRLVSIHFWSDPAKVGPCRDAAWVWKDARIRQMRDPHGSGLAMSDLATLGDWVKTRLAT